MTWVDVLTFEADTFNRTIEELKLSRWLYVFPKELAFNRTIEELK